mgnify:CR=1 FL=1|tara:strand:- start:3855 stop:4535 length:681 start_codon:yes stop_codon:yes gene_type:complete
MSYTTETITAFATLLEAVKGLQPDTSEAQKLAHKLITDNANSKNQAIAAVESMKYQAFLKAQEMGNAYAIEMLSTQDPDHTLLTNERYFKELDKGGYLKSGGQLPLDHRKVMNDAIGYWDTAEANQASDAKNAKSHLYYTGMNRNSEAAQNVLAEAKDDLASMISYQAELQDKVKKLDNVSGGKANLWDIVPSGLGGARKEISLDKKMDSVIDKQQSLVDFLEADK